MASNYSVDYLKKAAFVDELNNVIKVMEIESTEYFDQELVVVKEYLEKRIKEIDVDHRAY